MNERRMYECVKKEELISPFPRHFHHPMTVFPNISGILREKETNEHNDNIIECDIRIVV